MKNWNDRLQNQISDTNRTYDDFAKEIDVPKSTLTDIFRYHKEIYLFSVFKMTNILFNENRAIHEECCIEIFSEYKRNMKINMKRLFVISYLNGYSSILKHLVDLSSKHKNSHIQNYFYV
ncbi:hypothetical protein [Bacillus wiedmannii]|uniref:hypothetical protein n=1 Tax=Bacillus wiedmannii TaxID=1890302 RepID=UPI00211D5130|nr:hypothetical protein [Bacillus wiedmannii]